MDIHRCRFVPYPPSTINSLAFTHSKLIKGQPAVSPRLAVGRANGDIELWNPAKGQWLQETIIRGGKDRSIDALVWTQDPTEEINGTTIVGKSRLFSIGYTTAVTEWDLVKGRPLRSASGNHGEIWCLAAQPAVEYKKGEEPSRECQKLIAGCVDGALVLYSTADENLELQKVLIRPSAKKAKIISVAFQDRNHVIAGCSDSNIRIYDIRNGTMVRQMSLGSGPSGGPKEIIIWAVKALPNGDIVSADSTGEIKIWQGKTYSLMQRIKSHTQDVLSLATSADGMFIFSGGMDRRTVVYRHIKGKKRWSEIGHRRYHTHDVKTMASLECKGTSVVVSGGPDASPTILPLAQFGQENQRALPFLPQSNVVHSSPRKRLMMTWWDREIHIWRLNKMMDVANNDEEISPASRKLVAKILIKGEANITAASLSTAGNILAVATAVDVKMFRLKARKAEEGEGLKVSTIAIPEVLSSGARLIQFSPDGNWLSVIREDSQVVVARIVADKSSPSIIRILPQLSKLPRIDRKISKNKLLGGLGAYERTITQATFSSDSRILVVSDLAGYVDTWVLEGLEDLTQEPEEVDVDDESSEHSDDEDEEAEEEKKPKLIYGQHWTRNSSASRIPQLPATPVVLSFRPATRPAQTNGIAPRPTRNNPHPVSHELPVGEDRLVIVTSTNDVYEFEVLAGSLTPWSRRNPTSVFPDKFRKLREVAHGCIWDTSNGRERMWLYGVSWLFMFDLSQDLHAPTRKAVEEEEVDNVEDLDALETGHERKRKRIAYYQGKSGAGGLVNPLHNETGMSRKIRKTTQEDDEGTIIDLRETHDDAMDVDSPSEAENGLNDDDNDEEDGTPLPLRLRMQKVSEEDGVGKRPAYYKTFKYRPILGMVVIGDGSRDGEADPEVAVVERPIWEADLPARYEGEQEWEKRAFYG
ncbi:hypothetical protein CJF30_00007445 [Rutstroemia sp. NJR-2017a BBW]|nr:hypothetical protein CJF30_00007445 [Rutstroemia sp. NJR-2017a BBW]